MVHFLIVDLPVELYFDKFHKFVSIENPWRKNKKDGVEKFWPAGQTKRVIVKVFGSFVAF